MNFIPEWTEEQLKNAEKIFSKWQAFNLKVTHGKDRNVESTYGLPYTSSSSYAMIGNTNCIAKYIKDDRYNFEHVAITPAGQYVAVLYDAKEEELYIVM